jgi:branched-chain amino acid transport system ATP-binding protein
MRASLNLLTCDEIDTYYGPAHILFNVSLTLKKGQLACILGRNGAGKTTCLRSIIGLTPARSGSICFRGQELCGMPAFKIARLGIGYVPENRQIFPDLSVRDNLKIAERNTKAPGAWTVERAYQVFPALAEFRHRLGGRLSGGQQQMLAIARTLMGNPTLVLIDEPTEGLSPIIVETLESLIQELKRDGLSMLLAAQDVRFALNVSDHVYIMRRGEITHSSSIGDARRNEQDIRNRLAV